MSEVAEESLLIFTDAAASKVQSLIDDEGNDNLKLRVFVSGGGCSGFQYGFTFDEETACQGAPLLINELKKKVWIQEFVLLESQLV